MVSHEQAYRIMTAYGTAWVQQDTSLLVSLFAEDGVYAERQFSEPYRGRDAIAQYWDEKVVEEQRDISFSVKNVYVDGDTVVCEFSASAYSTIKQQKVFLESVCVFDVNTDGLIMSFREFWHSKWS